jgi:TatD DNase family protein
MNIWTDICVNLTNDRFKKDCDQVIERAIDAGVTRMVVTGTNLEHSQAAVELCERYPQHLRCTVGCHPHDAKSMDESKWRQLEQLYQSPFVVAVGECGLDFDRNFSEPEVQVDVFTRQLELAHQWQLPLFLHERAAHHEMVSILHQYRGKFTKAIVHCFTGDEDQLQSYLVLDLYIGITGWICDERRNQALLEAVQLIPNDRLMIETDAPYLLPRNISPKPKSGRNEPLYIKAVAEQLSEVRQVPADVIAALATLNSATFFDWPVDVSAVRG